ncbi:MAG: 2-hydroxyacyl-CoA dehydratase [bacterium]|nr:2-hydroxyacyl-CoA dehydratase [bacterium]
MNNIELKTLIDTIIGEQKEGGAVESSKRSIGYFCRYVPQEIIYAAGYIPFRIFKSASPAAVSIGDTYMQRNTCPFVRGCIGDFIKNKDDFNTFDGIIAAHTCDNIRGMIDNLDHFKIGPKMLYQLDIPRTPGRENNYTYYLSQLNDMKGILEELKGSPITEEELSEAMALFGRVRAALERIDQALRNGQSAGGTLNRNIFYRIIHKLLTADPALYINPLEEMASLLEKNEKEKNNNPNILLIGSLLPKNSYKIIDIIESNFVNLVDDYLCTGWRSYAHYKNPQPGVSALETIAETYSKNSPCPRMFSLEEREKIITEKIEQSGAHGVIYYSLKFCDPNLYDIPLVRKLCKELDTPFLSIETELTDQDYGQLNTRIQAFLERL